MPSKSMPVREAKQIAQKLASEMDVELIDVELVKEPTGHFLRFYIDKPDGISLNELEAYYADTFPGRETLLKGDGIVSTFFDFSDLTLGETE